MQVTADSELEPELSSNPLLGFSSYTRGSTAPESNANANNSWSSYLDSSDSSGSWTQGEGLPPPPPQCEELVIQASSIPTRPAKCWDAHSDDDLSDEGVAVMEVQRLADSESGSEDHDTESECVTEIYVEAPNVNSALSLRPAVQRKPPPALTCPGGDRRNYRQSDVIPSVSSNDLYLTSPPVLLANTTANEDISTNIDSGISNETSHVQSSHNGTVLRTARTLSVSSSSHYTSSYSCGSRGDIPSPKIGHQARADEVTLYMRQAKVGRVVSFLSGSYAVVVILLGVIFPLYEMRDRSRDTPTLSFEGFYFYLYGLGIFFLIYVYASLRKDGRLKETGRARLVSNTSHDPRAQPIMRRVCASRGDCEFTPTVGSLFIRITAVLFCAGSVVDSGLRFGVHLGDRCPAHFLSTIQPVSQAVFMFFEIYFIFNNAKMCVRQYPVVAKFGIMHLLATNISIWVLSTISEVGQHMESTDRYPEPFNNYTSYHPARDTESMANLLSVLNYNKFTPFRNCTHSSLMVRMTYKAKPYTYPCTVQFSLLVSCILFAMWRKVESHTDTECSDCKENSRRSSRTATRTIDCQSTSQGLIFGIFALLAAITCLIFFFVLTTTNFYDIRATLVIHVYQIALYLLMTVVAVVVLLKLRTLDHNACRSTALEDSLLFICLLALVSHDLLGIIAGLLNLADIKGLLLLATSAAELIQSVVQMAAVVMGLKLCVPDVFHQSKEGKPGRECVTFLVVANIALWVLSIFSKILGQGFDIQLLMLDRVSWNLIVSIVSPLVMFYHLYSASCFIDIWYNAYRVPSTPAVRV